MVSSKYHYIYCLFSVICFISNAIAVHQHSHASHQQHAALHHRGEAPREEPENLDFETQFDHISNGLLPRALDASVNSSSQTGSGPSTSSSTDFTCGPNKPCGNGACCGESGWCGYSPTYCGTGCQSNCDAKAECGQYAATPGQGCPLNVCCSEFGFCGTTSDFCAAGCQSHCTQPKPSVSTSDVQKRIIAYYEGWNTQHACGTMEPSEIPIEMLTHLNFAFGYITSDFKVTNMDGLSSDLYSTITSLKERNPSLKVIVALGGWTFSDPGPWQNVYPSMVSSSSNRLTFIKNLLGFLSQYGFDGVDFDWEYPGADDRGGSDDDGVNFTLFLKELRAAVSADPHEYIITFTAPTSYWYLRHFDITAMTTHVDWINLMTYDLHGVWDRDNPIGNQVLAHTNLTEIDLALDLFWRNDIDPSKIVMGLGFYGRSFQLEDASCWKPGCLFSGPGEAGPCTATGGILSYKEITDIISRTNAKPYLDEDAAVNYLVYSGNNWISYDDAKTFKMKIDFANKRGLSGIMVWAVDQDNTNHDALRSISPLDADLQDPLQFELDSSSSISHDTFSPSTCIVTKECGEYCPVGYNAMTRVGRNGDLDACPTNNFRYVCCPSWSAPSLDQCHWATNRTKGVPTDCAGTCNPGQVKIAGDSWGWLGTICEKKDHDGCDGHADKYCIRGGVAFCCDAGNAQQYLNICSWTTCGGTCASEFPAKPYEKTTDSGGPNSRCPSVDHGIDDSPSSPYFQTRKLCCPRENSLNNCNWHSKKSCSESCPGDQIEIDSDPNGPNGQLGNCYGSRREVYCCDPPGGTDQPFLPVDLDKIFPSEYLPDPESIPKFDLVSFAGLTGGGEADPNASGVAFFLIAGNSAAVSGLKKRSGEPEPFTFIDCPHNVFQQPDEQYQVARVVCTSPDVEGCFRVRERGVEGTIVQMPDNCGRGSWARAVSLELSEDQSLPSNIRKRSITSPVYDFTFDFNMALRRRDAGPASIRMDYSNLGGYWNAVVDSAGIQSRSISELEDRFFSAKSEDWVAKYATLDFPTGYGKPVSKKLDSLLYFASINECPVSSVDNLPEGFGAGLRGTINAKAYYGFSLIANVEAEKLVIREAAGFFRAEGETDITFDIGGLGTIDISKTNVGNPAIKINDKSSLGGHSIFKGWATFDPYVQTSVGIASTGKSDGDSSVLVDGKASLRLQSDLGSFNLYYPNLAEAGSGNDKRTADQLSVEESNILYRATGSGTIGLQSDVTLGLKVDLKLASNVGTGNGDLPDMSMTKTDFVVFNITDGTGESVGYSCLDYYTVSYVYQQLAHGPSVGWRDGASEVAMETRQPNNGKCYQDKNPFSKRSLENGDTSLSKRQSSGWPGFPKLTPGHQPGLPDIGLSFYAAFKVGQILAGKSYTCMDEEEEDPCCGCIDMNEVYVYTDIDCPDCNPDDTSDGQSWPRGSPLKKRDEDLLLSRLPEDNTQRNERNDDEEYDNDFFEEQYQELGKRVPGIATLGPKRVTVGSPPKLPGPNYPSFPLSPNWPWEGIENGRWDLIDRYYGNASANCEDWTVVRSSTADTELTSVGRVRAKYQTEHVFEGQAIGDFFTQWLSTGHIRGQVSLANTAQPPISNTVIRDSAWITTFIKGTGFARWANPNTGAARSFISLVLAEMGSEDHLSRFVIYQARPNQKKGAMFKGSHPTEYTRYTNMGSDAQLCSVKEWGMMYNFLSLPVVWNAFCETYEGVYALMGQFDVWYNQNHVASDHTNLQGNWQEYMRVVLDSMVERSRADLEYYYHNRRLVPGTAGAFFEFKWFYNLIHNEPLIAITQTCNNMPPTRARAPFQGNPDSTPSPTAVP